MLQRFSGLPGVLCLAFLPVLLSAADSKPTLLVDADHRPSISLDGDWHAIVDPYDNGYLDFRMQPRPDGYFLDEKPGTSDHPGRVRLCEVGDADVLALVGQIRECYAIDSRCTS